MSLSFSDRITVFLSGDMVHMVRRRKGFGAAGPEAIAAPFPEVATTTGNWDRLAGELGSALSRTSWRSGQASVILSNHFVRYALAPVVPGLRRDERAAAARHYMGTVFGEQAADWSIRMADDANGDRTLAAAVDPALIAAVTDTIRASGLKPRAIQPFLAEAYNLARRRIGSEPAWLAAAEPGRLCVAHVARGRLLALRSQRCNAAAPDALPALLEQVRLSADAPLPPGPVHVVSRGVSFEDSSSLPAPWRMEVMAP